LTKLFDSESPSHIFEAIFINNGVENFQKLGQTDKLVKQLKPETIGLFPSTNLAAEKFRGFYRMC